MRERRLVLVTFLLVSVLLAACAPRWDAEIIGPDGAAERLTGELWKDVAGGDDGVALERLLWSAGHALVESVTVTMADGTARTYAWSAEMAEAQWHGDGELAIGEDRQTPARVEVTAPASPDGVQATIRDIAPTAASALGLRSLEGADGTALTSAPATHVLLLFLDGLGYVRYQEALAAGDIPVLAALGEPMVALTVYPPGTRVATAALLTGALPERTGVTDASVRDTDVETLFDVAAEAGLSVVSVEGQSLAFNLRSTEVVLSGDRDGDGSTDDNVLANTLDVVESGMPDLLLVHFHGIDDAGHTYGPGAAEEIETLRYVDQAVGRLLATLPEDTMVIAFADHGMHRVQQEGRLGDHGHLIERDMLIPIWIVEP